MATKTPSSKANTPKYRMFQAFYHLGMYNGKKIENKADQSDLELRVPLPIDSMEPEDIKALWDEFEDWGKPIEVEGSKVPVRWCPKDRLPTMEALILAGLRVTLQEASQKIQVEAYKAKKPGGTRARGRNYGLIEPDAMTAS